MERPIIFTSCIYGTCSNLPFEVLIVANDEYEYFFKARHEDKEKKRAIRYFENQ